MGGPRNDSCWITKAGKLPFPQRQKLGRQPTVRLPAAHRQSGRSVERPPCPASERQSDAIGSEHQFTCDVDHFPPEPR